jgi:hypothetical protein
VEHKDQLVSLGVPQHLVDHADAKLGSVDWKFILQEVVAAGEKVAVPLLISFLGGLLSPKPQS